MKHLIIKRSEWARKTKQMHDNGPIVKNSLLSPTNNERCCMGFDAHYVCGIPNNLLAHVGYPSDIGLNHLCSIPTQEFCSIPTKEFYSFRKVANLETFLGQTNDRNFTDLYSWVNSVSDEEQEKIIARLYSLANYTVEFVD